jgi:hypothetical protein
MHVLVLVLIFFFLLYMMLYALHSNVGLPASKKVSKEENKPPRWIPVPPEERSPSSKLPCQIFPHCCIGQCRQIRFKHANTSLLFQKWSEPLANLTDLLHVAQTQTLLFLGDSLTSDHAMAAICQLMQAGYTLGSCKPLFGGDQYGGPWGVKECSPSLSIPFTSYVDLSREGGHNITIAFERTDNPNLYNGMMSNMSGIMLWNIGVHCHDEACLREQMNETLIPLYQSGALRDWTFLWKETEPQHFNNIGGEWKKEGEKVCGPVHVNNWRNEVARDVLAPYDIPIVPIFDALEPLWEFHYGGEDCTHYCYSPWRFDLTWNGMVKALQSLNGRENGFIN